jgi:sugar lactone lactonase YvrE
MPKIGLIWPNEWTIIENRHMKKLTFSSLIPLILLILGVALPLWAGILPLTRDNSRVGTLAGGGQPGSREGKDAGTLFKWPTGLAVDDNGNLFVADFNDNLIRKVTRSGIVSTFAGTGKGGYQDGTGKISMFHGPQSVAFEGNGNLVVADADNFRIRRITPDGKVTTVAGHDHSAYRDGSVMVARFVYPTGVTVDSDGIIFVADQGSHTIRKILPDRSVLTVAGDGTQGYKDGPVLQARFHSPTNLLFDPDGNLYVADAGNHAVRMITAAGQVVTVAGGRLPGYREGRAADARFHWPTGLAMDSNGDLYVSDSNNSRIRKVTAKGMVSTLAGTGVPGYSDGPAGGARFNYPTGLAMDRAGNLYVADSANHLIRTITAGERRYVRMERNLPDDQG